MANYRPDPNDSRKQVPGPLPDNARDRAKIVSHCTMSKTPSYVIINKTPGATENLGFFFGSSASFASAASIESGQGGAAGPDVGLTGSANYTNFGQPTVGTRLDIHPLAWSGSQADVVTFVYKSGLSGGPR